MFDLSIIGYLIPGLIAIWIEKQGLIETFSTLITSSVIVRLLLILITGGENL
ncbi:MAG TPA: poly-gamma-glutamate biosynthesis protein PgsC/CapC [bacterium]|nr:poly-gamma-glutamate biosynthesis protein PgsC/CapC [bacterium]